MAAHDTTQAASWLKDEYVDLHSDPTFVAEDIVLDIAVQIAEAMEDAGVSTQKELAERLNISPSAVSQLLSGDQNVSIHRLVRVALALGKTVEPPKIVDFSEPNVESRSRQHAETVSLDDVSTPPKPRSQRSETSPKRAFNLSHVSVCGEPMSASATAEEEESPEYAVAA
jgi:transcriptional regulator with XRE-family HTH domain